MTRLVRRKCPGWRRCRRQTGIGNEKGSLPTARSFDLALP
jgi:hypothetical protein